MIAHEKLVYTRSVWLWWITWMVKHHSDFTQHESVLWHLQKFHHLGSCIRNFILITCVAISTNSRACEDQACVCWWCCDQTSILLHSCHCVLPAIIPQGWKIEPVDLEKLVLSQTLLSCKAMDWCLIECRSMATFWKISDWEVALLHGIDCSTLSLTLFLKHFCT